MREPTPVNNKIHAPIKIARTEVSPTEPGIVPKKHTSDVLRQFRGT